ncbi:MAG: hypothetical protein CL930_12430 [Deltaproteobacteria bacterium]|jgi:hypothetical protein|nr:hypothetical protein [Deltaproteobacteria bacterium]
MKRTLQLLTGLLVAATIQTANAQAFTPEDTGGFSWVEEGAADVPPGETEDEALDEFDTDGRYIYLICIFGPRDDRRVVRNKCPEVKAKLRKDYPRKRIIRIDNPPEERLQRIKAHQEDNIAMVIIVTHSTPGPSDEDWDVWDTELDPIDFAECFPDEFIIWNGCHSRHICEQADNILPTQCDEDFLPYENDTWREIARCLFGTDEAVSREDVCEEVFGDDWRNRDDN